MGMTVRIRYLPVLLAIVAAVAALAVSCHADRNKPGQPSLQPPHMLSRTYDVTDLVKIWPFIRRPCTTCHDMFDAFGDDYYAFEQDSTLEEVLRETILSARPGIFDDSDSLISFDNATGRMTVIQTAERHKQIELILRGLRSRYSRVVTVDVQAVELDDGFIERMMTGHPVSARTDKEKEALEKAIKQTWHRTTLRGMVGQPLRSSTGRATRFVRDIEAIEAEAGVGLDSVVSVMPGGLAVQATATPTAGGAALVVDYRLFYGRKLAMRQESVSAELAGRSEKYALDLPTFMCDQRAGTVTLPTDCPTIVAGATVPAALVSEDKSAAGAVSLYYVLTAGTGGRDEKSSD